MSLLTDRASIRREYLRLVNADTSDADMIEHDTSGDLEGLYEALDVGQARAQMFLIGIGQGETWLTTSSTLTIAGTDPDRYSSLPADFLRLDSDPGQRRSGLRYPNGTQWGKEIHPSDRNRAWGHYYWVEYNAPNNEFRLRFPRASAVPSNLVADYYAQMATMADSTTVFMRPDDRNLIPAYAAEYAMNQAWFSGGPEDVQRITKNLVRTRSESYKRGRMTRRARAVQTDRATGRWIV